MRPPVDYWLKVHALGTAGAAGLQLGAGQARQVVARPMSARTDSGLQGTSVDWNSVIDRFDVVSIDVFDTLIARRVLDPGMVHVVVARVMFDDERRRARWPLVRTGAESRAREAASRPDVSLNEIYACVGEIAPDLDIAGLQASEVATELKLAHATHRGRALWAAVRQAGKPILVTTDIYLSRTFMEGLLRTCGYEGWAAMYVSGEDGTAKHDGTTFAGIMRELPGRSVLHIGDNKWSDVASARQAGVEALHLRRPLERGRLESTRVARYAGRHFRRKPDDMTTLQRSILGSLTESWLDRGDEQRTPLERIGYQALGPGLVGFAQYLGQQAQERALSRIVFLAREGAMLRRAFDVHTALANVETEYAVVSTRLLGIAGLSTSLTEADMQFLTKSPVPIEARQYLTRVLPDIDRRQLDTLLRDCGLRPDQRMASGTAATELRRVFGQLLPELAELAGSQRDATPAYLQGLRLDQPGTAVVDVGWQGTIQRAVSDLIGSPVSGLYWGLRRTHLTCTMPGIDAWVDQRRGSADARLFSPLFRFTSAFEVLLANTAHGSAAGVQRQPAGAGSEPQSGFGFSYLPLEFQPADAAAIRKLQDAAIHFVEDFTALRGTFDPAALTLTRGVAHRQLVRLLTRPSVDQYNALKSISFDGTYGVSPQPLGNWWVPPEVRRGR